MKVKDILSTPSNLMHTIEKDKKIVASEWNAQTWAGHSACYEDEEVQRIKVATPSGSIWLNMTIYI